MFETVMTSALVILLFGGFVAEVCWARNLVRQTLRDEELMQAFREFGRLFCSPFRSLGAALDQHFDTLVGMAQTVLWPKKQEEKKR